MQDYSELLGAFVEEAREHLPVIEASLLALEHQPEDGAVLNELFRSVHTIKGGAGFFGLKNIGNLTHSMESLLSQARNRELVLTPRHIDTLLVCQDRLVQMIDDPDNSERIDVDAECRALDAIMSAAGDTASQLAAERMTSTTDDSTAKLRDEAHEQAQHVEALLMAVAAGHRDSAKLGALFRELDALNKSAAPLALDNLASLIGQMQAIVELAKNFRLTLDDDCLETLFDAYECLMLLLEQRDRIGGGINIDAVSLRLSALINVDDDRDARADHGAAVIDEAPAADARPVVAEEAKAVVTAGDAEFGSKTNIETEESIRVHVKRLNKLINLAGELVLVRNQLFRLCEPQVAQLPGLKAALHNFNRITTEMQEEIMGTRMQPIGAVFNKFPRLIRQLEKDLGKELELVTEGADVELDKTIIESLADPVTHIIRNMADHGIETPDERVKKSKPRVGTLVQKAFHESGQVVIQFSDDGAGIDPDFIAAKALQKGIVTPEALKNMSGKDKLNLIFTPGFSTAATVSSVSGRGIGMDVVKTKIEQIGGTVDVQSKPGKWTIVTMTLPLTMAIVSALIVRVQQCRFAFPQGHLEEMVLLQPEHYAARVGKVHGQRMLSLRGDCLPLISLADSLAMGEARRDRDAEPSPIIIIKADGNRVAVIVDQILGSEEIVVKPMPEHFRHIKNFSGTSILGDGAIALIIDVQGYIQRNQLAYTELRKTAHQQPEHKVEQEAQALLIFDNNTDERFALALSWIQRIDTLDIDGIQHSAGNEYIEYHGEQMRLLRLEHCLPIQKPGHCRGSAHIIIPKHTKIPVALLINRVIDSKNTVIKLENTGARIPGVLGSLFLDGKITLMLDLHGILQQGIPESVERMDSVLERAHNKHILLVEDTPFFMRVIKEFATAAGYQVSCAANGREGLEMLNKQDFDLVLSDIEMPLMDGRELIKNIRANPRWQQLPVIALTTLSDAQTVQDGKKAGFNDWLVKLDKELVLKTLANYL